MSAESHDKYEQPVTCTPLLMMQIYEYMSEAIR